MAIGLAVGHDYYVILTGVQCRKNEHNISSGIDKVYSIC